MKIILILSVRIIAVTACKENEQHPPTSPEINYDEKAKKAPEKTTVNIEKEVTVGEASTKILDTGINRVSNINLACKSISGISLNQGKEFSFNKTVGERSKARGYKDAPVIFHGEKSYGVGGGVCQVSTTLYMAAVNASLEITEHHPHSESVAYAPGTDATVVYGEKDMKFKNNTDDTLYIYVWVQDEKVYGKIVKKEIEVS